ncbi:transmembrane protein 216 isoform X3 [Sciurus carolinensis]|uniref:transmembrane protein 216 isoform X3 n=1 Tax=Sciurus carolinensis TaxID=30640 RepID=UPI001FB3F19B|nr:transmembrane protein 216 isoform X3 [Sciurus carolinensis]
MAPRGNRLSSTPLEILFFLNGWYYATYFLLELFIFLYKGLLLPYPTANLGLDVVMLLLYLGIEVIRLFFVWTGFEVQKFQRATPHIPTSGTIACASEKRWVTLAWKGCATFPQH